MCCFSMTSSLLLEAAQFFEKSSVMNIIIEKSILISNKFFNLSSVCWTVHERNTYLPVMNCFSSVFKACWTEALVYAKSFKDHVLKIFSQSTYLAFIGYRFVNVRCFNQHFFTALEFSILDRLISTISASTLATNGTDMLLFVLHSEALMRMRPKRLSSSYYTQGPQALSYWYHGLLTATTTLTFA